MLVIHSFHLLDIKLVHVFDLLNSGLFILLILPALEPLPDNCDELNSRRVEKQRFWVEKQHSWHFYLVHHHPEFQPVVKRPKCLVLVQDQCRIQCIVVFQSVFNEPFPVLYENPELFRCRQCSLLEPSRQQAHILTPWHESLQVLRVDGLNPPESQQQTGDGHVEHKPTA